MQYPRCCFPPHELVVIFDIVDTAVVVVMVSIIINAQISMLKETFVVCVFRLDSQPKSLVVVTFKNRERNTLARFDRQTNVVLTNHPSRFPVSQKPRRAAADRFGVRIQPSIQPRANEPRRRVFSLVQRGLVPVALANHNPLFCFFFVFGWFVATRVSTFFS